MYATLISKIETTLGNVSSVSQYGNVPGESITGYPYVFFKPDGFTNDFETNEENEMIYRFLMVVVVSAEGTGGSISHAFATVLPAVVDDIVAQFNQDWDQGVVDGHRVRALVDSAAPWQVSEEEGAVVAYAPLNLQIKALVSV